MRKPILPLLALLLFLIGLAVILYPHLKGATLEQQATEEAETFLQAHPVVKPEPMPEKEPEPTPRPYAELYEAMLGYNETIYAENQQNLSDPWAYQAESFDLSAFGISGEVFGVLSVPALELEMPIYLGATEDHMAAGAAHLSQTSLPIGGANTNCVLAGHRGWNGADYFRHLDQLTVGDEVTVTNLWESLHYTVSEIKIIEPYDVESIHIQPGRELLTLLTCHPYASGGRYRYLVFCERID